MKNESLSEKYQFMYSHVESFLSSGLSIRNYAQKYGLTRSTLNYWVQKKRRENAQSCCADQNPSFVQVSFDQEKDLDRITCNTNTYRASSPQAILRFAGGLSIEIYA